MDISKLTKYERARLIGARSLQIAMGAPILIKMKKEDFERVKYSPIEIAKLELKKDLIPIVVKRPLPKRA